MTSRSIRSRLWPDRDRRTSTIDMTSLRSLAKVPVLVDEFAAALR